MNKQHIAAVLFILLLCIGVRIAYKEKDDYYKNSNGDLYLQDHNSYMFYNNIYDGTRTGFPGLLYHWHRTLIKILPGISLMGSIGYYPLLFMSLSALMLYIMIFYISKSFNLALLSAALFSINPFLYRASYIGFGDTNTIIFFMSFLILFLYILCFEKWYYMFPLIAALWLFKHLWTGYLYIVIITLVGYLLWLLFERVTRAKNVAIFIISATLFFLITMPFISNYNMYFNQEQKLDTGYTSIAELQKTTMYDLCKAINILSLLLTMLFMFVFMIYNRERIYYLLLAYFLITLFAMTTSVRFIFFFLLGYYMFMPFVMNYISKCYFKKELSIKLVLFVIIIALITNIALNSYNYPNHKIMNDDIYYQLRQLNNSKTIIAMWDKDPLIKYGADKHLSDPYDFYGKIMELNKAYSAEHPDEYFYQISDNNSFIVVVFPDDHKILEWNRGIGLLDRYNIIYSERSWLARQSEIFETGYEGLVIYEK